MRCRVCTAFRCGLSTLTYKAITYLLSRTNWVSGIEICSLEPHRSVIGISRCEVGSGSSGTLLALNYKTNILSPNLKQNYSNLPYNSDVHVVGNSASVSVGRCAARCWINWGHRLCSFNLKTIQNCLHDASPMQNKNKWSTRKQFFFYVKFEIFANSVFFVIKQSGLRFKKKRLKYS